MYEEIIDEETGGMIVLYTDESGREWSIPANESNRMYQDYLVWKSSISAEQSA